jgi:hypothetical protein
MKIISNVLFGIGFILLVVGIFKPVSDFHFGNTGLLVLIVGLIILSIRFIRERKYKSIILVILVPIFSFAFWKAINIPFLKGGYIEPFCGFNIEEPCFEGGYQKLSIKDWSLEKLDYITSGGNCGVAGCSDNEVHNGQFGF